MSKKVLVVGGNGQLGNTIVKKFISCKSSPWKVYSLDLTENPTATWNFTIKNNFSSDVSQMDQLHERLSKLESKFDSIICVAGGWEPASLNSQNILQSIHKMMEMNFYSSVLTAHLAQKFLNVNSLLALTASGAVKNRVNTTESLSYQLSKQGVENITDTLVNYPLLLPLNTKVITLCPNIIDTETNRKYIPGDRSNWVSPEKISTLLKQWSENIKEAPKETYHFL